MEMKYKFIKNEDLLEEIIKFNENQIITEKLHLLLFNLAFNISNKGNWVGYSWKEEMVSDAYLKCILSIDKFDIKKSQRPFSFFTTIVFHFYFDYIKHYKKHQRALKKLENDFKMKMLLNYNIRYDNKGDNI